MKLPIKKKYFDLIKQGIKEVELRDAHITFVCEETGEQLRKDIALVDLVYKDDLVNYDNYVDEGILEDSIIIKFILK